MRDPKTRSPDRHPGSKTKTNMKNLKNNLILNGALLLMAGLFVASTQVVLPVQAAINASEIVAQTNAVRSGKGLGTLSVNSQLTSSAQMKAADMASKGYFAHADEQGRRMSFWLGVVGYQYLYGGENLAEGFSTASSAMSGWMGSATHYANLVKPEYTQIGVGVAEGTLDGRPTIFVVQHFGTPKVIAQPVTVPVAPVVAQQPISQPLVAQKPVSVSPFITTAEAATQPVLTLDIPQNTLEMSTEDFDRLPSDFYFSLLLALWLVGMVGLQNEVEVYNLWIQNREAMLSYWKKLRSQLA